MGKQPSLDELIIKDFEYKLRIPHYPEGSDITLLNCNYIKYFPKEDDDEDMKAENYIYIIFKDNKTGEKKYHIEMDPKFTFYMINEEKMVVPEYNSSFLSRENLIPITCKYSDLLRVIAELTGNLQFFYDNLRSKNARANQALHLDPRILGSDVNLEDFYRYLFAKSYTNTICPLDKAFLDIEVDGRYSAKDFPDSGSCPVNAVSYLDVKSNTSYQLLLKERSNPLIDDYIKLFDNGDEYKKIKDFVINCVGAKLSRKYGVDKINYKILFFDSELDLLEALFDIINNTNPDMLLIYNMAFDLNYLIDRLVELDQNPVDFMVNKSIPKHFIRYYVDDRNMNNLEERGDYVKISSYTVWIDQMINFASIRKGKAKFASFKLDDIGNIIAGVKKLDYSHITTDIKMLPYLDYKIFSYYNIMDTIVQYCIEKCTQDCEYIFTKALVNNTRYEKAHRQSVYIMNRFKSDYEKMGFILGNNVNRLKVSDAEHKFPGAMVGNPLNNDKSVYMTIDGHPTNIANNLVDFDYAKLYPSIIEENNIASNTQIGKIIIDKDISELEHHDMYTSQDEETDISRYSRGGEFLENLMTGNMIMFFNKWFKLATFTELLSDMEELIPQNKNIDSNVRNAIVFSTVGYKDAIQFVDKYYNPDRFNETIRFIDKLNSKEKENLINKIKENVLL